MVYKLTVQEIADITGVSRQSIHSQLGKKNLIPNKSGKTSYFTHSTSKIFFNLSMPLNRIAFHHIKGGVGKTTTTDNVAACANALGYRVLLIDADFQKNLTSRMNIDLHTLDSTPTLVDLVMNNGNVKDSILKISEGVDIIASRFENATLDSVLTERKADLKVVFKEILSPIEKNYDLILIDCPAMLGKLVTAITLYSDLMVCPINPESHSIEGLDTIKQEFIAIEERFGKKINYKIYLNKFNGKTLISNNVVAVTIQKEMQHGTAYDVLVKESQEIVNALKDKKTVFNYTKKSEVKLDFINLTKSILNFNDLFKGAGNAKS